MYDTVHSIGVLCTVREVHNRRRVRTTDWLTRSILQQTVAVKRAPPYAHTHARMHARRTARDVGVREKGRRRNDDIHVHIHVAPTRDMRAHAPRYCTWHHAHADAAKQKTCTKSDSLNLSLALTLVHVVVVQRMPASD